MNSIADIAGMHGFGRVIPEGQTSPAAYAPFSHDWERRTLGIQFSIMSAGLCAPDKIRFVTESIPPLTYLNSSYFKRWLITVEDLLLELGSVTEEELATGETSRPPEVCDVDTAVARTVVEEGGSARISPEVAGRFQVGDRVRARNINPSGHTRLPNYIKGKLGTVIIDHGTFAFPDTNAMGQGPKPQHAYSVRFASRELWGADGNDVDSVQIDMFDDYLDLAEEVTP
ncbi:nitrile hydratase subunit beta [Celeribacter sp.]|uniref:nitrile hydratase subunit beta n=1 Tax=Celeribacter sp. TaxID=1890673 RepID=UPI003A8E8158